MSDIAERVKKIVVEHLGVDGAVGHGNARRQAPEEQARLNNRQTAQRRKDTEIGSNPTTEDVTLFIMKRILSTSR